VTLRQSERGADSDWAQLRLLEHHEVLMRATLEKALTLPRSSSLFRLPLFLRVPSE
jgi:hypothetical protein